MTSSLAAGKTASTAMSTKTAHRPWCARKAVTPLTLCESERRGLVHGADGTLGGHTSHVGAGEGAGRSVRQRPVPADQPRAGCELHGWQRADDDARRGL